MPGELYETTEYRGSKLAQESPCRSSFMLCNLKGNSNARLANGCLRYHVYDTLNFGEMAIKALHKPTQGDFDRENRY